MSQVTLSDITREIEDRRTLREWVTGDWLAIGSQKPPAFAYREQQRRWLHRHRQAVESRIVPWRLAHWLGRTPTATERRRFAAALEWFEGNQTLVAIRTGRRVVGVRLV